MHMTRYANGKYNPSAGIALIVRVPYVKSIDIADPAFLDQTKYEQNPIFLISICRSLLILSILFAVEPHFGVSWKRLLASLPVA